MIIENNLKKKLKSGRKVFGTWSMLSSAAVVNVIAQTGMDFIIIDMEHGPSNFETAQQQLYTAESAECTPIVRLADGKESEILKTLEIGIQSIMISHVSTTREAESIVKSCLYYPEGERGISPFTRNHSYSDEKFKEKTIKANENMFIGVLIEGKEGIENIENIASIKGLDMIYLGLYDISQTLGIPGELENPEVLKICKDSVKLIQSKGKIAGTVARDKKYLDLLKEFGFKFIAYRVDCAVLKEGFEIARTWCNEK